MLHIAFCDDSIEFQRLFKGALEKYCSEIFPKTLSYEILNGFESGEQVLKYIGDKPVDILFLDIDMPNMNGFELAKNLLRINSEIVIVFVSGYDQLVYDAFEFSPFAFLRKDRLLDELPKTLARIAEKFDRVNTVINLRSTDGDTSVSARDVIYIKAEGNYYVCYAENGKITCRGTLADAEKLFAQYDFFRIHSAYMLNLHYVQKLENNNAVVGPDCETLPIAQRRLTEFRRAYAEYTMRSFHI